MTPKQVQPTSAFVAVTLLCNSRCIHCDIWKNKGMDFLPLEVYRKLPKSLEMVDLTGGEPFLRNDLPEIVKVVRETCPNARILITTNGFLPQKIKKYIGAILTNDPNIAFRMSLDGWGDTHEKVRNIPQAFDKVMETVSILRTAGVKDIGLTFTLMSINQHELRTVYDYCRKEHLAFSLNVVHDSPIYFGMGKTSLSPDPKKVKSEFDYVVKKQLQSVNPKDWGKAWFNHYSYEYMIHHRRPLPCGAGQNFFYMDPFANIFMCNIKNWPIGNLRKQTFEQVWSSHAKERFAPQAAACNDCWISSTAKDAIKKNKLRVAGDVLSLIATGKPLPIAM
jgi:MoaA/NifB/PqqE/SkfB family radical SAM enzyme